AVGVESASLEGRAAPRVQGDIRRDDLHVRDLAGLDLDHGLDRGRSADAVLGADADRLLAGGEVDSAIGDRGSAAERDIDAAGAREELVVEALALLHARLEDVECRGDFAEVNLAVGEDRAAALLAFAVAELPELLAGLGVEAEEGAGFIGDVELAVVDN